MSWTPLPARKTLERYARIFCGECAEMLVPDGEPLGPDVERFLTKAQYDEQMRDPHRGWRCPSCRCYPCG